MNAADQLGTVLSATGPVLLDFDGPITPIFADDRNRRAADRTRRALAPGSAFIPPHVATTPDPLEVLRYAGLHAPADVVQRVDDALRDSEIDAAAQATPTPGSVQFLTACRDTGRLVVIVSNNGVEAISAYLRRFRLHGLIHRVIGRPYARPDLMKPHPTIIRDALSGLDIEPHRCVLVGDSITDIEVAVETGVRSIGYVKRPDRLTGLELAGADATTDSMQRLAETTLTVGKTLYLLS